MKTIFLISQKLSGGGAERVASNLSIELSKNNDYKLYLVLFDGKNVTYPAGCEVIDMELGPVSGKLNKVCLFLKRTLKLRKLKKQYHADISISLLDAPNFINVMSRQNDKVIVSVRNYVSFSAQSKLMKEMIRYTCRKADKVVSLSKTVKKDLIDHFSAEPNKVVAIYNSCDADLLMKLSEAEKIELPPYEYIVNMGRLMNQKGQWHLIKAFKTIHDRFPNLHLVILGEGELQASLQELIDTLSLSEYVHLYGYIKNPHAIIKNAKAFVFSSLYEGLGNVLLEALACGVPIISTDCLAGPKEILSECPMERLLTPVSEIVLAEYGILLPPFSQSTNIQPNITREEELLGEAIAELMSNPELHMHYKEKCSERIQAFLPEIINGQWNNLLNEMN